MKREEKGQILLLMLMVMSVSLLVGLSVSSRALNVLKQTTSTNDAQTCLNLAEAGVEDALQILSAEAPPASLCAVENLEDGTWDDPSDPPSSLDGNIVVCDLDGSTCGGSSSFTNPAYDVAYCIFENSGSVISEKGLLRDETYQFPLRLTGGVGPLDNINLHWSGGTAIPTFMLIGTDPTAGLSQKLDVGAFDPATSDDCDLGGTNDPATGVSSSLISGGTMINIPLPPENASYHSTRLDLRLRFLCADVDELIIEGKNGGGQPKALPAYSHTIRATCINQAVTREIEAVKWLPALPTIFDFGVYSGSETEALGD